VERTFELKLFVYFGRVLRSTIITAQCTICGAESYCFNPFYDISLQFPEKKSISPKEPDRRVSMLSSIVGHADLSRCSLDDCLREFTKEEVLEGDNMMEC